MVPFEVTSTERDEKLCLVVLVATKISESSCCLAKFFRSLSFTVMYECLPIAGTDEELIKFCFDTYDLNDDGYISREEMLLLLKDCMYKGNSKVMGE